MARKIIPELVKFIDAKLASHGSAQKAIKDKNARNLMIYAAEACVGQSESGGNNKGTFVEMCQKTTDGYAGREAWCMSFVQSMVAYAEHKTGKKSSLHSSEHCMTTWRKSATADRVKVTPGAGAIVIWQHGKSEAGHTGFMMEYKTKTMETVEGNTGASFRDGDGVYQKSRSTKKDGDMNVVGFIIPFPLTETKAEPIIVVPPIVASEPDVVVTTSGMDADEGTVSWYRKMFKACKVNPDKATQLKNTLKIIREGYDRYHHVAKLLGAPAPENFAYILGAIHFKEASCNFKGVLHNGEKIVGTNKKTTIVPKGRGPFATWEEAAVDAISMNPKRWEKLMGGSIDIGEILYALERYNGTGYITGAGKAENSPYLWACSTINDGKGKYVSDGKFDANASTGSTCGAALILKEFFTQGDFKVVV